MKLKLISIAALFTSACSFFAYSEIEYHNFIVSQINESSALLSESVEIYKMEIPEVMNETIEVNTGEIERTFKQNTASVNEIKALFDLKAKNPEQKSIAEAGLTNYISSMEAYLSAYEDMLTYYKEDVYKTEIREVEVKDKLMHEKYLEFVAANNELEKSLQNVFAY